LKEKWRRIGKRLDKHNLRNRRLAVAVAKTKTKNLQPSSSVSINISHHDVASTSIDVQDPIDVSAPIVNSIPPKLASIPNFVPAFTPTSIPTSDPKSQDSNELTDMKARVAFLESQLHEFLELTRSISKLVNKN